MRGIAKLDISEYYSDFLQSCCNLMLAIFSPNCVIQEVMLLYGLLRIDSSRNECGLYCVCVIDVLRRDF